ncbi:hypothetical protein [Sphingobacterium bovisgrunnientis]|uniref:hypothetical protein n=1 Tax=Sphingobacterium bovisgrunnientis TaxID=1874697 RepID=UPI0013589872|nr:hypothetical protein [Sphingobacterium bovisgrunnientis]
MKHADEIIIELVEHLMHIQEEIKPLLRTEEGTLTTSNYEMHDTIARVYLRIDKVLKEARK